MILVINNLRHKRVELWLYSYQPIELIDTQKYNSNDLLNCISKLLKEHRVSSNQIKYLGVIFGEGSFSGIRSAVNIANVYSIYNESMVFDLINSENNQKFITNKINKFKTQKIKILVPKYSCSPRITKPKQN